MLSNGSFANPKWTELSLGDLMFFLRLVEEKSLTEGSGEGSRHQSFDGFPRAEDAP